MARSYRTIGILTLLLLGLAPSVPAREQRPCIPPDGGSDERPPVEWAVHVYPAFEAVISNIGLWGDPWEDHPSFDWPEGTGSSHMFNAYLWGTCFGNVTPADSAAKWASCANYGDWELSPSEGDPLEYLAPGPLAPEQSWYGIDDWDPAKNANPFGMAARVENYAWDAPGYDGFLATSLVLTHHSEHGNPGVPLRGLVVSISADGDVATADSTDPHLDDLVAYDGSAIWCNDPAASFEYVDDYGIPAHEQDAFVLMRNPDNPLPPDDPDNVLYHYDYFGVDGLPDHDADGNGVSDQLTILAKVSGGDTTYIQDPETGILLFSEGMPSGHWAHGVGDTTFLVVPRNLSYMWDSDLPGSAEDDTGEPLLDVPCNGYVGWRLLDCWIEKAGGGTERPIDVLGVPIPLSHQWWNWEEDPGTDGEMYDFTWGLNPGGSGLRSGPAYLAGWVGDPDAPEAVYPENPGPFPFVRDNPLYLGYPVFDYRFLLSMGPFTLADGDTLHIVGGWVIGRGLDGLRRNADLLLDAYCRASVWGQGTGIGEGAPSPAPAPLRISPNPASSAVRVGFTLGRTTEVNMEVFDLSGRVVLRSHPGTLEPGDRSVDLEVGALAAGIYLVRLDTGGEPSTARLVVLRGAGR